MRFGEKEPVKEKFYAAKRPIKSCDVNVNNIVILKLIETKNSPKYLIWIKFERATRPLV